MLVCPECGTRNPPGTQFCGECGTFLEWAGDTSAADSAAPVVAGRTGGTATATTAEPASPSTTAASQTVDPEPAATPVNGTTSANATTVAATPLPPPPPTPVVSAPPPTTSTSPATTGESDMPRLVQPGERQHRYQKAGNDEPDTLAPGEVACSNCGVGNVATRKFCRSCGTLLAAPPESERRSWWRRLLDRLTRRGRYEAGTRRVVRDRRRWLRPIVTLLALAGVVVSLTYVLPTRTYINRAVTAVRDRVADRVPTTPVSIRASSSAKGTTPNNVSDGLSDRYWAPAKGPVGQWIEVKFERPVRLLEILVTPGISPDKQKFLTQGRPHELSVDITDSKGKVTTLPLVVQDDPKSQTFAVKVSDAVQARFTIVSGYDVKAPHKCAIAELEFGIRK